MSRSVISVKSLKTHLAYARVRAPNACLFWTERNPEGGQDVKPLTSVITLIGGMNFGYNLSAQSRLSNARSHVPTAAECTVKRGNTLHECAVTDARGRGGIGVFTQRLTPPEKTLTRAILNPSLKSGGA